MIEEKVSIDEWKKFDLRIGTITAVEDHPNAANLYVLAVDLGDYDVHLVAGVKKSYKKEELIGKQVVVIINLKPANIRGVESQGMLLAAIDKDKISLITPDKKVCNASPVQ